ncbi:hypothetical protein TNCT_233071 [Trichonephila clavata]|uniref:Uncharacterized protein n=1 Tax=Trichonephila clavata TaxID=2740835 RepID=A0A8X6J8Y7_TRICU|nr:hypothetical protein TNCT_233071 [Trichonephila clavata]
MKILTRMQATRKRRKEELVKQSDNESVNEESPPPSHQASKSPAETCRKTDGTVCVAALPKDICAGLYVLVQLLCKSGKKKKITQYHYVGVCQSNMDEDEEIKIQFLATIDGKRFTEIVNEMTCSVKTLSRSWKHQRKILMEI